MPFEMNFSFWKVLGGKYGNDYCMGTTVSLLLYATLSSQLQKKKK